MVLPLSIEQLALPAASHRWTIGEVIQHLVANRVWWFQVWMGEGGPELAPIAHWDPAEEGETPVIEPAQLVAGLGATWEMIQSALDRWTPADVERLFPVPSALREEERQFFAPSALRWIVWHVLEHEIHHGGELSVALGAHGLPGIYGTM
jgi:uncharacterized damage-inducible protein DinB